MTHESEAVMWSAVVYRDSCCELITSRERKPSLLKGGMNEALTSRSRREGQRVRRASVKAPVSMFNYTTITRIKPNSSIKDCSVIINAFNQSYTRSLQASGVTALLTERKKREEKNMVACGRRVKTTGRRENPLTCP